MSGQPPGDYSDSFVDYNQESVMVRWSQKTWDSHTSKHQELKNDRAIVSQLIKDSVGDPSIVMEGGFEGQPLKRIYYKEIKCHQHFITFTKVACVIIGGEVRVATVFQATAAAGNVVKERAYPERFKEVCKNKTNIY